MGNPVTKRVSVVHPASFPVRSSVFIKSESNIFVFFRVKNKEQRTKSKEQGTKSKESRAEIQDIRLSCLKLLHCKLLTANY